MNEEEFLEEIELAIKDRAIDIGDLRLECLQGLLDLYNTEKQKNKELENADLTTVYMNGFYNGEKKWKDKIKNKIKEINETYEELEEDELGRKEYYYPNYTIDILEELLGE